MYLVKKYRKGTLMSRVLGNQEIVNRFVKFC